MTQNRFVELCGQYNIAPEIALENPDIVLALHERDDAEVERILREEF